MSSAGRAFILAGVFEDQSALGRGREEAAIGNAIGLETCQGYSRRRSDDPLDGLQREKAELETLGCRNTGRPSDDKSWRILGQAHAQTWHWREISESKACSALRRFTADEIRRLLVKRR